MVFRRGRPSIAAVVLFFALIGCVHVSLSAGYVGDDIKGRDVETTIDRHLVKPLKTQAPGLIFSRSKCADHIDVSNGKIAHCIVRINGDPIPVRVVFAGAPEDFKVSIEGRIYEMAQTEQLLVQELGKQYGIRVSASCGKPRIRMYKVGEYFECAVQGSPLVRSMRMRAVPNGVFVFKPRGLKEIISTTWMTRALDEHEAGASVSVSGSNAESYLNDSLEAERSVAHGPLPRIGKARCPKVLLLSGKKHATCVVPAEGLPVRYDIWIDDAVGFRLRNIDVLIDMEHVAQVAQKDLNERLAANGDKADAVVDCGRGAMLVEAKHSFYCHLMASGQRGALLVEVTDHFGALHWRVDDMMDIDPSPVASP